MMSLTSVDTINGGLCMLSTATGICALNLDLSSCPTLMYLSNDDTHITPQLLHTKY